MMIRYTKHAFGLRLACEFDITWRNMTLQRKIKQQIMCHHQFINESNWHVPANEIIIITMMERHRYHHTRTTYHRKSLCDWLFPYAPVDKLDRINFVFYCHCRVRAFIRSAPWPWMLQRKYTRTFWTWKFWSLPPFMVTMKWWGSTAQQ